MLDVEDDWLLRWTQFEALIGLLQMPAIDEAGACCARFKLAQVAVVGREVAHAFIGNAGFVIFVRLDQLDRVVQDLELIANRDFEGHFDILWKSLGLDRLEDLGINPGYCSTKETRSLAQQEFVEIDDRSTLDLIG